MKHRSEKRSKEYNRGVLSVRRTLADQTITHHREVTSLVTEILSTREALAAAVRLIDHFIRNECLHCRKIYKMMTPADLKRLEEIRATAS